MCIRDSTGTELLVPAAPGAGPAELSPVLAAVNGQAGAPTPGRRTPRRPAGPASRTPSVPDADGTIAIGDVAWRERAQVEGRIPVSYTHLRAHETVLDLVCRLLLEKKNT